MSKKDYSEYIGKKINFWTIISIVKTEIGTKCFVARCDCGTIKNPRAEQVVNNRSRSCGCYLAQGLNHRKEKGHAGLTSVFISYKKSAETRNLEFNLTREEFKEITQKNCFYCDAQPSNETAPYCRTYKKSRWSEDARQHAAYRYSGIDRVNNKLGYVKDNIVACCKICNYAKNKNDEKVFLDWVKRIYSNLKDKNII